MQHNDDIEGASVVTSDYWLLLQVKPREEQRALENLQFQGAEGYCPQIGVGKMLRGKRQTVIEPLFPGYLFLPMAPINQAIISYTSIRCSRGVSKIVGFGDVYSKLPNSLIESIRRRVSDEQPLAGPYLPQKGDKVQIMRGPFRGLEAIYQQPDGNMRSMVLISLLHQQALASMENTAIKKWA
jgi:transcriptional antiterminator RfaH